MFPITRLFESEHAANGAVSRLADINIARGAVTVIHANDAGASDALDAAIQNGAIENGHRRALKAGLAKGRSIVSVTPVLGQGRSIEIALDSSGAVDSDTIPDYLLDSASPLSDLFGIPVLTKGDSHLRLARFDGRSSFGFRLLSKRATPLSSMFGLKVLSSKTGSRAKGTAVERMSGKPAPFSSALGLKLLTKKKGSRAGGSSVDRMSGNPAPLSSFLGLPSLTRRD